MAAIDDFFDNTTSPGPTVVTVSAKPRKRKRAAEIDDELQTMKKKARSMCSCIEQWKSVSKYKTERLKQWIQEKEYDQMKTLENNIFDFVTKGMGTMADAIMGGESYIYEEITSDISLRNALQSEFSDYAHYLSNQSKIVFLSIVDIVNGKMKQLAQLKENEPIIEEVSEGCCQGQPVDVDMVELDVPLPTGTTENIQTQD